MFFYLCLERPTCLLFQEDSMTDNMYCRLCLCENNLIDMSGSILAFIKNVFLMEVCTAPYLFNDSLWISVSLNVFIFTD